MGLLDCKIFNHEHGQTSVVKANDKMVGDAIITDIVLVRDERNPKSTGGDGIRVFRNHP